MSGIDIQPYRRNLIGYKAQRARDLAQRHLPLTAKAMRGPEKVTVHPIAPLHSHRSRVYVPPVGSIAMQFLGRVIPPVGI